MTIMVIVHDLRVPDKLSYVCNIYIYGLEIPLDYNIPHIP